MKPCRWWKGGHDWTPWKEHTSGKIYADDDCSKTRPVGFFITQFTVCNKCGELRLSTETSYIVRPIM